MFASELKSLLKHPHFQKEIDVNALTLLMRYMCIPQPYSIYKNIYKLLPGKFLELSLETGKETLHSFWDSKQATRTPKLACDEQELLQRLDEQLRRSVAYRMKADVAYGAFLSGGIDSSLIVSLMQAQSGKRATTFSIGFHQEKYNEAPYAKKVAQYLQTDHHELYVSEQDALAVIPSLSTMYDEPFADSSQIPMHIVSRLARQQVAVCLSGDGGDELFSGYHRHFMLDAVWRKIGNYPEFAKRILANGISLCSPDVWNAILKRASSLIPSKYHFNDYANKLQKLQACLRVNNIEEAYSDIVMLWHNAQSLVLNSEILPHTANTSNAYAGLPSPIENLMYLDFMTYLPDDLLCKVDRASMAVGLEVRVPFLDHHFVEFAWSIPMEYKIKNGQGKYLLRKLLSNYVPSALTERPKMGFSIPLEYWLRNNLKDWAENLLEPNKLKQQGFFNDALITKAWKVHLKGKMNCHHQLWPVLMFQAWLEEWS